MSRRVRQLMDSFHNCASRELDQTVIVLFVVILLGKTSECRQAQPTR